jgi:hypothetical protein
MLKFQWCPPLIWTSAALAPTHGPSQESWWTPWRAGILSVFVTGKSVGRRRWGR